MEHLFYCILYAFISILCRLKSGVCVALPFFNCLLQFPHFGLPSGASYLLWIKTKKGCCCVFLPKENLSEQTCLAERLLPPDYASLCARLGDAMQASLYFGMELESSVCLLFGHFCCGLAVLLINMDFQFQKFGLKLSHPGSDYSGCCVDMQCLKWKIFRI